MTVYEMAERYYPRLWGASRLAALREVGRLTATEYAALTGAEESGYATSQSGPSL